VDAANKEEAWTGFFDEREQLISFWEQLNKPVFVMTGDLHNSFAVKITDKIWEFCCGPHNSVNHVPALDESNRPATGPFQFGPRACDIRWSSYILPDLPRLERLYPHFCVVQINNVFNMPQKLGGSVGWLIRTLRSYFNITTAEPGNWPTLNPSVLDLDGIHHSDTFKISLAFPIGDGAVEGFDFQFGRADVEVDDVISKNFSSQFAFVQKMRGFLQRGRESR